MSKKNGTKNQTTNGSGTKPDDSKTEQQAEPKAYKSVMKAFEMTQKHLFEGKDKAMYKNEAKKKIESLNGGKCLPEYERLPKDFEADTSPTAQALIKAVRMTRRRLYPELYQAKKRRA